MLLVLFLALYCVFWEYGTSVCWQPWGNWHSQKIPYVSIGFLCSPRLETNPRSPARACTCHEVGLGFNSRPREKTFEVVGSPLTTSVSTGQSKDNGSILLNTRNKAKKNTTIFLTNALNDGTGSRSIPNRWPSFSPEWSIKPSVVSLRKGFLLHDTSIHI